MPTDGGNPYLTFTTANWDQARTIKITAVADGLAEGKHSARIIHTLTSNDDDFNQRLENDVTPVPLEFELDVALRDKAGVAIIESDESTFVVSGTTGGSQTDSYDVVLTSSPAIGTSVTITVESDGLTTVDPTSVVFTPTDWYLPKTVTVTAVENPDVPENELKFSPADQRANVIQGPLTVWSGNKPGTIRGC